MHDAFTPTVFKRHNKPLRAILIDRQPWFVANDVGRLLGQRHAERLCRRMDTEQIRSIQLRYASGSEEPVQVINQSGLYKALYRFMHPEHRSLSHWFGEEVIPHLHDLAHLQHAAPRRVQMNWQGAHIGMLDWQGELWVRLQQLPTLANWQEAPVRRRWFG
ncbi:phage antirepressor [Pseudomonas fulva]|uniref:BRO-N domain-containing protein n=1 Tax=Pseudomonas fulva TaxID=47880 RepID=UPI00201E40EF|nr:BRO family protein [Pseudomonas fulva]UQY32909.1 phage antirepressor [Pseudomonas fulva]